MKQNPPIALALRGVSKRFDRPAVDALDLTVYGGEFYVLVGPNGAGKTTTLRMVVGLLRPDAGSICIEGIDALADPVAAKQVTAWLSDEPMIYDKLTPLRISRVRRGPVAHRACNCRSPRTGSDRLAWSRTACARALRRLFQRHAPESGAGRRAGARPEAHHSRRAVDRPRRRHGAPGQERAARARRAGGTVIMTTHILEVAERMADRIGVIAGGRLIAEGTLEDLRRQTGKTRDKPRRHLPRARRRRGGRRVSQPGTLTWLAGHELRLGWRDWTVADDGRAPHAGAHRRDRADRLCSASCIVFAYLDGGALCGCRSCIRHVDAGRSSPARCCCRGRCCCRRRWSP